MAIPPLEFSLACTGVTGSVHNQILSGETASGSDPVATVATRTFSAAGAEADATSLPPPESGTVPGAAESTKSTIYRLLDSYEICEKMFEQFQVTRSCNLAVNSIQVLVIKKLHLQIRRPTLSKVLMAGRAILLGKEQKKSCYVGVAQAIIDKVGKGRPFKVVPTAMSGILEASPGAMCAIKAGVDAKWGNKIILTKVTAILKEDGLPPISDRFFKAFVFALKAVLRGQIDEIEQKLKDKNFRTFYPLAQKIAEMDTSSAPKRARETSDVLSEAGAGAGGKNISSDVGEGDAPLTPFCEMEDFSSRAVQEERASKRARKTSDVLSEARAGAGGENSPSDVGEGTLHLRLKILAQEASTLLRTEAEAEGVGVDADSRPSAGQEEN